VATKTKSSKSSTKGKSNLPQGRSTKLSRTPKRGEPKSMEELLAAFKHKVKVFSRGEKVKGKVVDITPKSVVMDIGGKSEGLVAEKAFDEAKEFIKGLEIGDEVLAKVIVSETPDGFTILSLRGAAHDASWKKLEEAKKDDKALMVYGKGVNPSGLTVETEGLTGFIPNSQLGKVVAKDPSSLIGQHFKAKLIEVDRLANKIVLSEKAVSEEKDVQLAKKALKKVKIGEIYEGKVTTIADFGCFVEIHVSLEKKQKVSIEGLVHISELSWEKVGSAKEIVSGGDKVKVKVIGKEGDKLALSIKQALKDPWEKAGKKYKKDKKVKGKVVKTSDFGVFVQLEPGVEGLVHMTKIPPGVKLERGKEVDVYIEKINEEDRKLSLGLVLTKKPVGYK
jgi:small subunit ribosomal protein S1